MQLRKQRKQILKQKQRENLFDVSDQIPKVTTQDPIRTQGPMRSQNPIKRNQVTTCSKQQLGKKNLPFDLHIS